MHPGDCWAFAGSQGFLVVRLSHVIYVKGFSYEHVPAALLPTGQIDSAPRNFTVWVSTFVYLLLMKLRFFVYRLASRGYSQIFVRLYSVSRAKRSLKQINFLFLVELMLHFSVKFTH